MLKNQWYVVLESKEVKKDKLLGVKRLSKNLLFFRNEKMEVVCVEDKCSHRGAKLSIGQKEGNCISCPFHGFLFNEKGECVQIPANGKDMKVSKRFNVKTYPTYETGGFIFLYNGTSPSNIPEFFDDLDGLNHQTTKVLWNTHYSRAIENQLDVVHLPFVHKKTIGKKNKRIVNGPKIMWDDIKMTIYVFNEVDNGQKPLKASEMNDLENYFKLKFIMPNVWQNKIAPKFRATIAFVPIDEESTYIYLRVYQGFINVIFIKDIFMFLANLYNKKILKEDYKVVNTQTPRNTHEKVSENLIQGDTPIGQYRQFVYELISRDTDNKTIL